MSSPLRISLGPLLFYWPRRKILDFYAEMAGSAASIVYLGEVVCSRRHEMKLDDWLALGRDLAAADSAVAGWLVDRLEGARVALVTDEGLRQDLEGWIKRHAVGLVERHHGRLATFIERGIHALGPAGAVRLIEEHAGDDLQYIRVNGTVVGGLAGGAIYALHLLVA
jgi:uncharacterized membrane-anchored protein YjiN (DUF445 family)